MLQWTYVLINPGLYLALVFKNIFIFYLIIDEAEHFYVLSGVCFSWALHFLIFLVDTRYWIWASIMGSAHLSKQAKLQMALELVRKEMEETFTQEANLGKKTVIWKVRNLGTTDTSQSASLNYSSSIFLAAHFGFIYMVAVGKHLGHLGSSHPLKLYCVCSLSLPVHPQSK